MLKNYIYDFSNEFSNQIKRLEIKSIAERFFGTSEIQFVAIDASCDKRQSNNFISFYGGAIGCIGNTGLGIGYVDNYWNIGLSGWIMPRFYDANTNQSQEILGDAHNQAIVDYINIVGVVNSDDADRKTIEEWVLLGDPSLFIGGY